MIFLRITRANEKSRTNFVHYLMMSQLKIILADDDPDDCYIFSHVLSDVVPNAEIACLSDCESLLRHLKSLQTQGNECATPDLIFLDLNMPIMSGQECLMKIKEDHICKNVPVIIYSTASRPEIIQECRRIGASLYIVKPTSEENLRKIIMSVIAEFTNRK